MYTPRGLSKQFEINFVIIARLITTISNYDNGRNKKFV